MMAIYPPLHLLFPNEVPMLGASYLWASGWVRQPLDEAGVVFTFHLRRQHAHSLGSMASKLALLHHLHIHSRNITHHSFSKYCHNNQSELYSNSRHFHLQSVCRRIHLEADMLQEDLQERQCQLFQLTYKMTVITKTETKTPSAFGSVPFKTHFHYDILFATGHEIPHSDREVTGRIEGLMWQL